MRGDGGGSDAMLASARLGDDARLAHLHGEKPLADSVVDFVRTGVEEIFALEIDARTAEFCGKSRGKLQGRRTASKICQQVVEFGLELRFILCGFVDVFEFVERHHQGFGNVAAAVGAETPGCSGWDGELGGHGNINCRTDGEWSNTLAVEAGGRVESQFVRR